MELAAGYGLFGYGSPYSGRTRGLGSGDGNGFGIGSRYCGSGSGAGNGGDVNYGGQVCPPYTSGSASGFGAGDGVDVDHATPIIAYHYVAADGLTREHEGRRHKVMPGLVLRASVDVALCHSGLHASLTVAGAQECASDINRRGILTRVACSGRVRLSHDKLVCSRRKVLEIITEEPM